jgi:hypothetical protein
MRFLFRHFDYLVKTTALMLEIQVSVSFCPWQLQLAYTYKPGVYVRLKNATNTPHKLLLHFYEAKAVNSVNRNNSCVL